MNIKIDKASLLIFRHTNELLYIIIGPIIAAFGISIFYTPAHLLGGGATGIGNIFFYLFGFDQGITMMCINLPLVFWGMKNFGLNYGLRTFIGSTLLSFWVSTIGRITGYQSILDIEQPIFILLSAIFGGIILGTGIGLTMKSGCNTGGTDVFAQILASKYPFNIGSIQLTCNAIIVSVAGIFLGVEAMLFSIIAMFCSSRAVNYILVGMGTKLSKSVYIISDYHVAEISRRVVNELGHSGTLFSGTGLYTAKERDLLLVVVPNHQLRRLVQIINDADPKAFVFITEAYQVLGKGFKPIRKVVEEPLGQIIAKETKR